MTVNYQRIVIVMLYLVVPETTARHATSFGRERTEDKRRDMYWPSVKLRLSPRSGRTSRECELARSAQATQWHNPLFNSFFFLVILFSRFFFHFFFISFILVEKLTLSFCRGYGTPSLVARPKALDVLRNIVSSMHTRSAYFSLTWPLASGLSRVRPLRVFQRSYRRLWREIYFPPESFTWYRK